MAEQARLQTGPVVREIAAGELRPAVAALLAEGWRFLTSAAVDERRSEGAFRLDHAFLHAARPDLAILRVRVPAARPDYPSLVSVLPAVHWDEREVHDLFGIVPLGHPDPRRLVLPDDWPADLHPLRLDVPWDVQPTPAPGAGWTPCGAHGEGVVRIPVGPVHAGIIESGHFSFSVMGEAVLHVDLRLFQKHRGLEKVLEGRVWTDAAGTVERVCAACTASHQAAWSEAVEQVLGWHLAPRAVQLRTVLLECERLWNHLSDLAALPAGAGFAVAAMDGARLKERMLRLQSAAFGHRYLFGTIRPGGVMCDLAPEGASTLRRELGALRAGAARLAQRLHGHPGFMDRATGTGVLRRDVAAALGAVGPSARASGIPEDLRVLRPYLGYRALAPMVVAEAAGDVAARLRVRCREIEVSFALLDRLLHALPAGPHRTEPPAGAERASGLGIGCNESPRGANAHYVELRDGRVARCRIRSASFANWPLLGVAVPGNLIGDFPLINKSFELCYACCDR